MTAGVTSSNTTFWLTPTIPLLAWRLRAPISLKRYTQSYSSFEELHIQFPNQHLLGMSVPPGIICDEQN